MRTSERKISYKGNHWLQGILLSFAISLILVSATGQDKTQYLLYEVPQTISLNPAISYDCKKYIQLPVFSQISGYYRNNGFSYKQVFNRLTGTSDSVEIDMDGLSKALGNRNHIRLGMRMDLLGFGYDYADWYFSLNISYRSAFRLSFNRDIIDARDGNWDLVTDSPREIDIDGTGIHLLNYTEIAFGASYKLSRQLSVGLRPKYLLGAAHLQTRRSDIRLLTSERPVELTGISDLKVRGSVPVTVDTDDQGYVTGVEDNLNSSADLLPYLFSWNHGFAVDAGFIYEYSDDLVFSASVLDAGFIHWRKNIHVVGQQEEFIFRGIDFRNYVQTGTDTDILQTLRDSISNAFRLSGTEDPYVAMLPFRMLAGIDYRWSGEINFGAVAEGEILSGRLYPSLTFTAIARPVEWFTGSLSYSLMDRGYGNLGFGIILGNFPVQFYLITDNIPVNYVRETWSTLLIPYIARSMNLRFGLNIVFGCQDNKDRRYYRRFWRKSCPAYDRGRRNMN